MKPLTLCEVDIHGYEFKECELEVGGSMYGSECLIPCHCDSQCDYITGSAAE